MSDPKEFTAPLFLVPDTNVFLHCQFFTELDRAKLADRRDIALAVCPAVLEELSGSGSQDGTRHVNGAVRRRPFRLWRSCSYPLAVNVFSSENDASF